MLSLLVLAGGESSRMGSPKALLKIGSETFLQCIVRKGREAGIHSIVLITGADHDTIVEQTPPGMQWVKNEDFKRGQISSLQAGIRSLTTDVHAIVVWPVDQPLVRTDTLIRLIDSFQDSKKPVVVPVYLQRRGHPVIYGRDAMQWALDLKIGQTGKDLHTDHLADTMLVDVNDAGILIDIDTPDDYRNHIRT